MNGKPYQVNFMPFCHKLLLVPWDYNYGMLVKHILENGVHHCTVIEGHIKFNRW